MAGGSDPECLISAKDRPGRKEGIYIFLGEAGQKMRNNVRVHHLQELRKERGKTQEAAAGEIGISMKTLSDLENQKKGPEFSILLSLASYYKVSVDFLCGRTDHKMGFEYEDISNITGLSENAIIKIITGDYGPILSKMIESDHFPELMDLFIDLTETDDVIDQLSRQWGDKALKKILPQYNIQALTFSESLKHRAEFLLQRIMDDLECDG